MDADGNLITYAPTAEDLAAAPSDSNIDFPGSALDLNCDVELWFNSHGPPPPEIYGRVTTDPDHPGFIVVQYWFYWMFNDWNNRHEGDWEMMQLVFKATSAAEALTQEPSDVVLAQHDGAEHSPWSETEQRDGRPVVYAGRGSHATFFEQDHWLGKSPEAGFGCDDTRAPAPSWTRR